MLGGDDTKKLTSVKMLDRAGLEKDTSTQYLTWGWHEKSLFTESAWQGWY